MPKLHERERKIKQIESGKNVRPPYNWFHKMLPTIKKEYPDRNEHDLYQILGGIWNNYSDETKIKIINEYQTDNRSMKIKHKEELGKMRY